MACRRGCDRHGRPGHVLAPLFVVLRLGPAGFLRITICADALSCDRESFAIRHADGRERHDAVANQHPALLSVRHGYTFRPGGTRGGAAGVPGCYAASEVPRKAMDTPVADRPPAAGVHSFEFAESDPKPIADQEPLCLYLETTNRCNLLCQTCPRTFEHLNPRPT
jgi:hypothetical protein